MKELFYTLFYTNFVLCKTIQHPQHPQYSHYVSKEFFQSTKRELLIIKSNRES